MFKKLIFGLGVFTSLLLEASFDDGVNAYNKGDLKTAFTIFEDFAKNGNKQAQAVIGDMYSDGEGVEQNYFKAYEWYEKAANQGYALAQNNLGLMYYNVKV